MSNTITINTLERLTSGTWSFMTPGAADTVGLYNDFSAADVATYFGEEHSTMATKIITLGGTTAFTDPGRYRFTMTLNFNPSLMYSFSQPYVGSGSEESLALPSGYDLDDFDMQEGFYPPLITSLGGGQYQVKMHLYPSEIEASQRFQGLNINNLFFNFSFEAANTDVAWNTGTTMADVLDAYPDIMGDTEGEHTGVDENGNPQEDMGGPPRQVQGLAVYTNTENWDFIMDSQTGRGAMMGIRALGNPDGGTKAFRMFVPYRLAQWMGVNCRNDIQILDENGQPFEDSNAEIIRIDTDDVNPSATDYTGTQVYRRGFLFEVPIDFSQFDLFEDPNARGARTGNAAATFMIGQGTNPCFHGTTELELVNHTRIRIDALKRGHRILSAYDRAHTVRAVLTTRVDRAVVFRPGAFGENLPSRRLIVTDNHMIKLPDGRQMTAGEAMGAVVSPHRTRWMEGPMTVYHVCLDDWTWLNVGGIKAETCAWLPEHHGIRPKLNLGQHAASYMTYQNYVLARA